MKPLATTQQILTWICLLPADENTSKWMKIRYIALVLALILADFTVFASSLFYVLKFISIDVLETSIGLYQVTASIIMANAIIVAFLFRHKIPSIFEKLSEIFETCNLSNSYYYLKNDVSLGFLAQANDKSKWLWKIYFKFVIGVIFTTTTLPIASVLICWLWNGYSDVTLVYHPWRFILPWDQSTLIGYFGEIIYGNLVSGAYLLYSGAVLLTFVSICLHHQAFSQICQILLRKLNRHDEYRNKKKLLCEIINFHNSIKSWFSETAEIYSLQFMVQLICNMWILALYAFLFDLLIYKHFDITIFVFSILGSVLALLNLFLCCFLGKLASESYKKIADSLYNDCNWHELPLDLQKYFIIMIADAQIPLHYNGYGIITLNLETFCDLLKAVYTYYMIFKTFTAK